LGDVNGSCGNSKEMKKSIFDTVLDAEDTSDIVKNWLKRFF